MISLQKFFGKDDQFLDLLEASAKECQAIVEALKEILKPDAKLSLDQFAASRRKDKQITNEISELLCKTSVTGLEREDIESIANSLYKIPKTVEKFAERYIIFSDRLRDVSWDRHLDLMGQ
ncbi:MAG: phosphate transport regulator, partial [Verrucomicrobiaceae bacterium]|nr:phosphate transport regulator [Verrucomicrobiaceae bacterium]